MAENLVTPSDDLGYLLPSIHPAYARLLCAHMRSVGVDLEALFAGNSLSWDLLLESPDFISFSQFRRIANNARNLAQGRNLELEISSMIQASSHGPLGYGALAAPTVRETFRLVQQMLPTRLRILQLEFIEEEQFGTFKINSLVDLQDLRRFVFVMLLGSFVDLLEKTTGQKDHAIKVAFPFSENGHLALYEARFPLVDFTFNADCFEVTFPSEMLGLHCLTADEFAYRNAVRECTQLMQDANDSGNISRRVQTYLFSKAPNFPTQESSAEHFNVSVRTLIRRLKADHTSYQELLDKVRKELAVWYLSDRSLSIEVVAERLGYVDTSNFSRVFRRWYECTPSDFRLLNR
jgi:AraC-like DNA-binding protein